MSFLRSVSGRAASSLLVSFRRSYSVRSSSSVSSFSASRGFEWRKLVSPHTAPATIEAFKEIETSVTKLSADVAGAPAAPGDIDWTKWSKSIKTPGAVAELRKQYESTFATIDAQERASTEKQPAEIIEFNKQLDAVIAKSEAIAKISTEEANKLKTIVKDLEAWNNEILDGIVPLEDHLQRMPGLNEQLNAEYENGEFLPTEAETRFGGIELSTYRAILENAGEFDAGGVVPADRFGDFKPTQIAAENTKWLQSLYGPNVQDDSNYDFEFETDPYADENDEHH